MNLAQETQSIFELHSGHCWTCFLWCCCRDFQPACWKYPIFIIRCQARLL